jgi:hypothetical protein
MVFDNDAGAVKKDIACAYAVWRSVVLQRCVERNKRRKERIKKKT